MSEVKTSESGKAVLAVVVPCYKEEAVVQETNRRLTALINRLAGEGKISSESYVMYVNDGSTDRTWRIITAMHEADRRVRGVNLAANVGHQNALVAGLTVAKTSADIMVTIDADLQDDVDAMERMIDRYREGADIVYGVRSNRKSDTWFKRNSALAFYRLMQAWGVRSVYNHADYRLMSRRAVEQLLLYRERNLFLRGMVPLIGYRTACVYYERAERFAGESKYPLSKMLNFAADGITSFSVKPVRMVLTLGLLFLLVSLGILVYVLVSYFCGHALPGWSSLMLSLWFCSGCVLTGLGIIGEYIGKIYIEVKDRPRFNIESVL